MVYSTSRLFITMSTPCFEVASEPSSPPPSAEALPPIALSSMSITSVLIYIYTQQNTLSHRHLHKFILLFHARLKCTLGFLGIRTDLNGNPVCDPPWVTVQHTHTFLQLSLWCESCSKPQSPSLHSFKRNLKTYYFAK